MEITETDKEKKKRDRMVRRFQFKAGSKNYDICETLCYKSKNMYNYTLHILNMLWKANDTKSENQPAYYLGFIDPQVRNYIVQTVKKVKNKETGKTEDRTYYNIEVKSSNGNTLSQEQSLYRIFGTIMNQSDYRSIQTDGARSSVLGAVKSVKAYSKSLVDYHKNPSKYKGEPRFPRYKGSYSTNRKDRRYAFAIDNFKVNKKTGTITVNGTYELDSVYIDNSLGKVKQIRIVPKPTMGMYVVEVVYEHKVENINNSHNIMGIDIGVNNLAAITITDIDGNVIHTEIVDGKPLKSINQYFNKEASKTKSEYCRNGNFIWKKVKNKNGKVSDVKIALSGKKLKTLSRKRYNKIETYMHTMSKHVIDVAKSHDVCNIFVGHNNSWKQNCNMGRTGNQRFVCIPFNRFISMLEYKGNNAGIVVMKITEEYTSKCSALDGEEICKHEKYIGTRRDGKRCKEFVTSDGILVNADINGSLNILRKGLDILTGEKQQDKAESYNFRTKTV